MKSGQTLVFSADDLRQILRLTGPHELMDRLIARLEATLSDWHPSHTEIPVRAGFTYQSPAPGLLEWMPLMEHHQQAVIKVVGYHPDNPRRRGMPTIVSTVSRYDVGTGHLAALADATFLTALRTGAASAVASRVLANPESRTLGMVGCGAQAVTQIHALSRVFNLDQVLAYDIDPAAAASLAARVAFTGLRVTPTTLAQVEQQADILCTATSVAIGAGPVISGEQLKPDVHINALGSDFPGKTELPLALLQRSLLCPDFVSQALAEGESQQLSAAELGPDLAALVQSADQHRAARNSTTVFDSTGWALEDWIALEMLVELGDQLDIGTPITIETGSDDPLDPYAFASSAADLKVAAA